MNDVIAAHLIRHNKRVNPALEYAKCVTEIIEKWQRKHKKDVGSFAYNRSEQLKAHLSLLAKGKHGIHVKGEITKFVSREVRDKADLRAFFVADDVLSLVPTFTKARKAAKRAAKP